MKELIITEKEAGQRFDKFLKKYLNEAPGSFIYKMLRKKNISLNGKKADGHELLNAGDQIKLFFSDETLQKFHREKQSNLGKKIGKKLILEIVYEDDDLIFINKPANMLTQRGNSQEPSLTEYLLEDLKKREAVGEEELRAFRPSPANRLDRNTTGLVLCSKSLRGAQFLSELIKDRNLKKEYTVLVLGSAKEQGIYRVNYRKDNQKNQVTLFPYQKENTQVMVTGITPIQTNQNASKLNIELITGKTHQIRAHMAYLKHPVLGDRKYGDPSVNDRMRRLCGINRQMLHARQITFPKISGYFSYLSGKTFIAKEPEDLLQAEKYLKL